MELRGGGYAWVVAVGVDVDGRLVAVGEAAGLLPAWVVEVFVAVGVGFTSAAAQIWSRSIRAGGSPGPHAQASISPS